MAENETYTDKFGNRLFWQGAGWYASRQDGLHIGTYLVPEGLPKNWATQHGLGYPYWLNAPSEWLSQYKGG